ncbi:MAG: tetratricopeptide repeat protein [Oscillatoria princeps RMCB-10]|jgi:tetratricopeptide (TPR) repeat protein|nr:tetratricopeptide repeat protein [Oscillatoria princeps RMCB-10]
MDEQRMNAYWQLIQKRIECPSGEESKIFTDNSELLDPGVLEIVIAVAKKNHDDGHQNAADFLINLALELGEFLGSDQQPTAIRKHAADILFNWGIKQAYISQLIVAFLCWQQCLIIYTAIHDRQGQASSLGNLGITYDSLGDFEKAIEYHEVHLAISREIKDRQGESNSLGNLGIAYSSLGQYEKAITFHEQSLAISRELKDRQGEASSLGSLGNAYDSLGDFERAIDFHKQSLAIKREIKDRRGEAASLGSLGNAYDSLGHFEQAIAFHEKSLVICREIKHRQGEATSLVNLGGAYRDIGRFEQALTFDEQSLAICQEIKDRKGEARSLVGLGNAYECLGQFEQALGYYEKSLAICREIKYRVGEAAVLGNLGNIYCSLGQFERAITFHEQSLAIQRDIKDRQGEASSLGSLGNAYESLGQFEQAIAWHEQSLAIEREIKHRQGEASSLGSLGNAYESLGQFEQAIAWHEQSLAIEREIKHRRGEAASLGSLGNAYESLGQFEQAIAFHEKSLAIKREIKHRPGEAASLINIGYVYNKLQQPDKAIKNYRDSLKIATPETMPPECFASGNNLGNLGFLQGNWQLALEGYEPAMQAVEQLRKGSTTDKRRQEIIEEAISVYANAVQCYINLQQYDKAVETADRSRSRHLADLFASKDLYPQGEIPPEVEEYYRLQQQIYHLRSSDNDGMKALAATHQPTPNSDAILKLIEDLEAQKQQAWLKIRSKDKVLAGQLQADPLSFQQMQALIPDTETAILNFYTTPDHTHIFILRQNQPPQVHTCEGQGYATQNWIINNWLNPYLENRNIWSSQMRDFLPELANRLQLNQLIAEHLTGIKELIIIPHLYLHQIPFAALPLNNTPIPQSNTAYDNTRVKAVKKPDPAAVAAAKTPPQQPEYLSDKFRIRIVPSCQILNYCHQRGNLKIENMGIVENATGDLVFTGYECETLATTHKVPKNRRLQYQQATISNYQNLLHQVQVLHSSHHAASNLNNSLESILKLFDGDINLARLFTWRFPQLAEVILSCCETNLTLTPITDDPLSIAAGFLCAGARNVVSTLWSVDDLATALFCILYYEEKRDKSRSEAIRQAQFKLRNLTGDELYAKYKPQLEAYVDRQQWGENQAEIMANVRLRLEFLRRETLPFVSPHYWSGFVSQGLA